MSEAMKETGAENETRDDPGGAPAGGGGAGDDRHPWWAASETWLAENLESLERIDKPNIVYFGNAALAGGQAGRLITDVAILMDPPAGKMIHPEREVRIFLARKYAGPTGGLAHLDGAAVRRLLASAKSLLSNRGVLAVLRQVVEDDSDRNFHELIRVHGSAEGAYESADGARVEEMRDLHLGILRAASAANFQAAVAAMDVLRSLHAAAYGTEAANDG